MVTNKVLVLLFLGSAILLGVFQAETREQKGPARRSLQDSVQKNLTKVLEDDEDGARQLFLLGDEAVSPLIKFLSDSDQGKRVAAAKGLAYIGNPQGMQALRNAINAALTARHWYSKRPFATKYWTLIGPAFDFRFLSCSAWQCSTRPQGFEAEPRFAFFNWVRHRDLA